MSNPTPLPRITATGRGRGFRDEDEEEAEAAPLGAEEEGAVPGVPGDEADQHRQVPHLPQGLGEEGMKARIEKAQEKLKVSDEPRNQQWDLKKGHLYKIGSRNLPYGVYDGRGGFIGIREKFGSLYLFTELDWDCGPPFGTVTVREDLGPIPEDIEPAEGWWVVNGEKRPVGVPFPGRVERTVDYVVNIPLYKYLAEAEKKHGPGIGYGERPGDPEKEEK